MDQAPGATTSLDQLTAPGHVTTARTPPRVVWRMGSATVAVGKDSGAQTATCCVTAPEMRPAIGLPVRVGTTGALRVSLQTPPGSVLR